MYNVPGSATAAEDITALMSWAMLRTVPLLCGFVTLDDMKKWPPARLWVECVAMEDEDHVTCLIGEDGVLMACRVIEE